MTNKHARTNTNTREEPLLSKKKHNAVVTKDDSFRLGYLGWSSRGYIPHYNAERQTQHVTFRLADSLPAKILKEWEGDLQILPEGEARRRKYILVEQYLDRGHGDCFFARLTVRRDCPKFLAPLCR